MAAGKSTYFKIGVFVIVGTFLLLGGVVALGLRSGTQEPIYFETYFEESVQGVAVGSPVKQRGVQVGTVTEIGFADFHYKISQEQMQGLKGRPVYVRMAIDPSYVGPRFGNEGPARLARAVSDGLRVRLVSQGITGLVYIEAERLDPKANPPMEFPWTPRDIYIPSAASTGTRVVRSIEDILTNLGDVDFKGIGANLSKLLENVDKTLTSMEAGRTSDDVRELVAEVKAAVARIRTLLEKPDVEETLASIRKASAEVEPLLKDTSAAVRDIRADADKLLSSEALRRAVDESPAVVAQLRRSLQRLERLVAANEESVTAMMRSLRQVSLSGEKVASNAEEYPSAILFGEPPSKKLEPAKK